MNYSAWRSRAHTGGTVYLQMIMAANIIVYSDIYIVQYVSNIHCTTGKVVKCVGI